MRKSKYKRSEFITYLKQLPAEEEFCTAHQCPMSQYIKDKFDEDISCTFAATMDSDFAVNVDCLSHGGDLASEGVSAWSHITPMQCLDILDRLTA